MQTPTNKGQNIKEVWLRILEADGRQIESVTLRVDKIAYVK